MMSKAFQKPVIAAAQTPKAQEPLDPFSDAVRRVMGPGSVQTLTNHHNHAHDATKRDIGLLTVLMSFVA